MKKVASIFLVVCIVFITKQSMSLEKGKWSFVKDNDWCYIGSSPIKSDLPETKKRGENYILVYKIIGSEENIIQIEAGYKYNLDKKINVKIDNANYDFYSTEDSSETAWTNDDKKVIYAMKKGLELTLTGESARGTITNDVYTLKGFTNAVNQLNQDC
jgi:invasion protein IalB